MSLWKRRPSIAELLGIGLSGIVLSFTPEVTGWRLWVGGTLALLEIMTVLSRPLEKYLALRELRKMPEFPLWKDLLASGEDDPKRIFALRQIRLALRKYSPEMVNDVISRLDEGELV